MKKLKLLVPIVVTFIIISLLILKISTNIIIAEDKINRKSTSALNYTNKDVKETALIGRMPTGIKIDHTDARLNLVKNFTETQKNAAKSLKIAYWHTSHGSQLTTGLNGLTTFMTNLGYSGFVGNYAGLNITDYAGYDLGANMTNWDTITRTYLASHTDTNVIMWAWCGQLGWMDTTQVNSYLTRMNQLESDFPNVTFVYMTGHLFNSIYGLGGNNSSGTYINATKAINDANNATIRAYCETNNKVFYDFADIESYDPNDTYYENALDDCSYVSGGNTFNWASAYQDNHTVNVDWYNCLSEHSQPLNANLKAYAAWNLMVQIAANINLETGFTVTAPTFTDANYGYSSITAKGITITNKSNISPLQVKSVALENQETTNFVLSGSATPTIVASGSDSTSYTIKPKDNLHIATYIGTIKVTDINDQVYTGNVVFKVIAAPITGTVQVTGTERFNSTLTATPTDIPGALSYKWYRGNVEIQNATSSTYKLVETDIGKIITVKVKDSEANYSGEITDATNTIGKAIRPLESVVAPIATKTHNSITITNVTENQLYAVTTSAPTSGDWKETGEFTGLNPNTEYTVYTKIKETTTYDESESKQISVTTDKLSQTITGEDEVNVKLGNILQLSTKYSSNAQGATLTYTLDGTLPTGTTFDNTTGKVTAGNTIGEFNVKINSVAIGNYNVATEKTITVNVVDKDAQIFASGFNIARTMSYGDIDTNIRTASLTTGNGTITYSSSDETVATVNITTGQITILKKGTTTITASASATVDYNLANVSYLLTVEPKTITPTVTVNGTYTYTSSAIIPADEDVIVKDNDTMLVKDTDYTVSYSNNTNAGEAKVIITAKVGSNYSWATAVQQNFTINKVSIVITDATVSNKNYDGNNTATVSDVAFKNYTTNNPVSLIKNTDYSTIATFNSADCDATKAQVTVTLINNNYKFQSGNTFEKNSVSINKVNYLGIAITGNKRVTANTAKTGITYFTNELALPEGFKNISYSVTIGTNTDGLLTGIPTINENNISFDVTSQIANKQGILILTVTSLNYNNYEIPITITTNAKEVLEISGLNYADRDYNENEIEPTGELVVSENKVPTNELVVLYESTDNKGYSSEEAPKNAGEYKVTYSILASNENYTGSKVYTFTIRKATPKYTVPSDLTAVKGDVLSTIQLKTGWEWKTPNATLDTPGNNTIEVVFTPTDANNYKTISTTTTVYVKNIFKVTTSVDGENGLISDSSTNVVEGTNYTVTFTPNKGYMVNRVKVNNSDVIVNENKYIITNITSDKEVIVSYKKIPLTITINSKVGVKTNPEGTINVNYGDSKEITITASIGYNIKFVKVNGKLQELPLINDKIILENIIENMTVEIDAEKIIYEVINGDKQKYTIGADENIIFRIDAKKELFNKVYIDNVEIAPINYIITEGSTIITVKEAYLKTLANGEHTLKAEFNDGGEAITSFTIEGGPEELPKTGIDMKNPILLGIILLIVAFSINRYIKMKSKIY